MEEGINIEGFFVKCANVVGAGLVGIAVIAVRCGRPYNTSSLAGGGGPVPRSDHCCLPFLPDLGLPANLNLRFHGCNVGGEESALCYG